jgi:hypothetical protein
MAFWLAERGVMAIERLTEHLPKPDPGVSRRTLRTAHELRRPGVKALKEREVV